MPVERSSPYIWVTWLTKLLVGENHCEWATWFKAHFQNYEKVPSTFDETGWQVKHTELINRTRTQLEAEGKKVFTENQNSFTLKGKIATLGGKPDLIAVSGQSGTIYDTKTGKPSPSHHIQVMTYMYAVPLALGQYKGMVFDGKVVYKDREIYIPSSSVDQTFIENLTLLIKRVADATPARRVPSDIECGFCDITKADCPARVANTLREGVTDDF